MLTRHWYPRDAVGKALITVAGATQWRDPLRKQKLIFWTYELVLSEEWEYMWEVLGRVATRWGNQACFMAVHDALQSASRDPIAVLHFLHLLLALPALPPYEPPSVTETSNHRPLPAGLPEKPVQWSAEQRARLWWAVKDAQVHGRSLRLLRLLAALPATVAAEYLGVALPGKRGIYHMLEMAGFPVLPTPVTVVWPAITVGRVSARLFSLPRAQLIANATRGSVDPLATREGCAFWRRLWSAVDQAADPVTAEEALWSTYFVDDVPDEWSAAEQGKSHIL